MKHLWTALFLVGCGSAEAGPIDSNSFPDCPTGSETCDCTEGNGCDSGLECRSGVCIGEETEVGGAGGHAGDNSGGEAGAGAEGASGGSAGTGGEQTGGAAGNGGGSHCVPKTCFTLEKENGAAPCGDHPDGCGNWVDCASPCGPTEECGRLFTLENPSDPMAVTYLTDETFCWECAGASVPMPAVCHAGFPYPWACPQGGEPPSNTACVDGTSSALCCDRPYQR